VRLLSLAALFTLAGCVAPTDAVPPPLPFDDDDSAQEERPLVDLDVQIARVDGGAIPQGSPLSLTGLRIDCAAGPDPNVDNEDPLAEAIARWLVTVDVEGWASVTDPMRLFLWDGVPDPDLGTHRLAWPGRQAMAQAPSGSSTEPFGHDRWVQSVPVFEDPVAADTLGGTTLSCLDGVGDPAPELHNAMVCALDARDLETRHCWFCGPHLGEPSSIVGDTVGRISNTGVPGLPPLTVTAEVECAYGPVPPDEGR